jgi:hypothetical protein
MGFVLEFEDYYVPIELDATVRAKDSIKSFYYGCKDCKGKVVSTSFCPTCNKETCKAKIFPEGNPEEVGGKDLWDFKRVTANSIDIARVNTWKYLRVSERTKAKKPKASEIAKWKEQVARFGKSKTLRDLFLDLALNNEAIECKIVFTGKVNDAWILPYPFYSKFKCLIVAIADGNTETVNPTEIYNEIMIDEEAVAVADATALLLHDNKNEEGE